MLFRSVDPFFFPLHLHLPPLPMSGSWLVPILSLNAMVNRWEGISRGLISNLALLGMSSRKIDASFSPADLNLAKSIWAFVLRPRSFVLILSFMMIEICSHVLE